MKHSDMMIQALQSYRREVKRLKSCAPDWKPIPLEEYIQRNFKKSGNKRSSF